MPSLGYEVVLQAAYTEHEEAVQRVGAERKAAATRLQVEKGRKLLIELMRPDKPVMTPNVLDSLVTIRDQQGNQYALTGMFPLKMTEVGGRPTRAVVVIGGNFTSKAVVANGAIHQEDPLRALEPQVALVSVEFIDEETRVNTSHSIATFKNENFVGDEATGFLTWPDNPADAEPLPYDSELYLGLVELLVEASRLRNMETTV